LEESFVKKEEADGRKKPSAFAFFFAFAMISFLPLYCFLTFLCEGLYSFPESCNIKEF